MAKEGGFGTVVAQFAVDEGLFDKTAIVQWLAAQEEDIRVLARLQAAQAALQPQNLCGRERDRFQRGLRIRSSTHGKGRFQRIVEQVAPKLAAGGETGR